MNQNVAEVLERVWHITWRLLPQNHFQQETLPNNTLLSQRIQVKINQVRFLGYSDTS